MHKKYLILMFSLVSLLVMAFWARAVFAGCCNSGSVNGVSVYAFKENLQLDSLRWRGNIISATGSYYGSGPAIDRIGWTWWQVYEKCNGATVEWKNRVPVSEPNKSYQARSYEQRMHSCNGSKEMGNKGTHEFKDGGQTKYLSPDLVSSFN